MWTSQLASQTGISAASGRLGGVQVEVEQRRSLILGAGHQVHAPIPRPHPTIRGHEVSPAIRLGAVSKRTRIDLALVLMAMAIVLNLVLLFSGETSPGWPLAAVILLGAAGASLLSQRREY